VKDEHADLRSPKLFMSSRGTLPDTVTKLVDWVLNPPRFQSSSVATSKTGKNVVEVKKL
jgi:hypothetical protein